MYSFFHVQMRVRIKERVGGPYAGCVGVVRNFLGLRTITVKGEGQRTFNYYEVELEGGKGTHRFADEELELP